MFYQPDHQEGFKCKSRQIVVQKQRAFHEEVRDVVEEITSEKHFTNEAKLQPRLLADVETQSAPAQEVKR